MLAKMPAPVKGLSSLVEPLYAPGHVLMDDDLTAGIVFTRSLSRLLLRSLFGCGVICGYGVLPKVECERLKITIQPGVALDCHGDPVEMKSSETLTIGDACGEQLPPRLWVMIRRAQHACAPRELACPSDDEDDACGCHATRARAGYELKVVDKRPCGACGCTALEQPPAPPGEFQPQPGAAQPASMIRATNTGYGINVVERRILDVRDRVTKLDENHASWTAEAMSARERAMEAKTKFEAMTKEAEAADPADAAAAKARTAALRAAKKELDDTEKTAAELMTRADGVATELHLANEEAATLEKDAAAQPKVLEHLAYAQGAQSAADLAELVAPRSPCHEDHYNGVCACGCDDCCDGWVLLGSVAVPEVLTNGPLDPDAVDYHVRRFIRPVLAADPYWQNPPTLGA